MLLGRADDFSRFGNTERPGASVPSPHSVSRDPDIDCASVETHEGAVLVERRLGIRRHAAQHRLTNRERGVLTEVLVDDREHARVLERLDDLEQRSRGVGDVNSLTGVVVGARGAGAHRLGRIPGPARNIPRTGLFDRRTVYMLLTPGEGAIDRRAQTFGAIRREQTTNEETAVVQDRTAQHLHRELFGAYLRAPEALGNGSSSWRGQGSGAGPRLRARRLEVVGIATQVDEMRLDPRVGFDAIESGPGRDRVAEPSLGLGRTRDLAQAPGDPAGRRRKRRGLIRFDIDVIRQNNRRSSRPPDGPGVSR